MASPTLWRASYRLANRGLATRQPYRCLSCSLRLAQQPAPQEAPNERTTHFGFETVDESQKASRVATVFSSVAPSYDTMNDLMSLGIHRLWKDRFARSLNPGSPTHPQNILDIAGGTADVALRLLAHAQLLNNDTASTVTISDINPAMLAEGRKRAVASPYASRCSFLEANAEDLSSVESASVDLYTVAFGIRNFTSIPRALAEAYRVLKPGGVFACLEFSKVRNPVLEWGYKRWSFSAIPLIGQLVAGDRDSYQYLVESIERFPSQEAFARLIQEAGFETPRPGWEDLSGGIACVHKGVKPLH